MNKIKRCPSCGAYFLSERCEDCGVKTINPKPPSFSPEDRYGEYRRKQKRKYDERKKRDEK